MKFHLYPAPELKTSAISVVIPMASRAIRGNFETNLNNAYLPVRVLRSVELPASTSHVSAAVVQSLNDPEAASADLCPGQTVIERAS